MGSLEEVYFFDTTFRDGNASLRVGQDRTRFSDKACPLSRNESVFGLARQIFSQLAGAERCSFRVPARLRAFDSLQPEYGYGTKTSASHSQLAGVGTYGFYDYQMIFSSEALAKGNE